MISHAGGGPGHLDSSPANSRTARVEENVAAVAIELSPEQLTRLDKLTPAAGDHHSEEQMRMIER